jgi:hypothetical protein
MAAGMRKQKTVVCRTCKIEFSVAQYKKDANYCSRPCKKRGQIKERTVREIACIQLGKRMATLMWEALRKKKAWRKWEDLVGYSVHELMAHLESKFQPGMTWENRGEWHVDHIRPRSSFSYETATDEGFLACWAMENLQPLWALDNLRKGSKYEAEQCQQSQPNREFTTSSSTI